MSGHHVVEIHDEEEARVLLKDIGVDPGAYLYLLPKAFFRFIKLKDISARAALIIKQEMLSKGGEAAISRSALSAEGTSDVLLMGNLKHYRLLIEKLKVQPFGLKPLAVEIEAMLGSVVPKRRAISLPGYRSLELGGRPLVMGILNVTPDSFSDGGKFSDQGLAVEHALEMAAQGADIIDIGGASSRPGAQIVDETEELSRVLPVVERLAGLDLILSIDTFRGSVAEACLEAGVHIVNDIGRLQLDPGLLPVVVKHRAMIILMHNRMQMLSDEPYKDLISDIIDELHQSIVQAEDAGVAPERIVIDPGIGFGKTAAQSRYIIRHLSEFHSLGYPILLGASRKSFIGKTLNLQVDDRLEASLAVTTMAVMNGADIIRVHDVKENRRVIDMTWAIMQEKGHDEPARAVQ
ncbi:MAG: dihydropteroate synthase [Deltaproteobacteria bacterium]